MVDEEEADDEVVAGSSTLPPDERVGRSVRHWVPGALRDARWEPSRSGAVLLAAVAAVAAVLAAVGVWRDRPVPEPVPALPTIPVTAPSVAGAPAPPAAAGASPAAVDLVISVVGRVARPGLVRVADGARVADALDAAGGALPDTDLSGLNLARRLTDGEQLLVGIAPPLGMPVDPPVPGTPGVPAAGAPGAGGPMDLNSATLEQLDTLPGIGPVTAQRILDWRTANGRFTAVEQLREVGGIGESRFAQLRDLVRV